MNQDRYARKIALANEASDAEKAVRAAAAVGTAPTGMIAPNGPPREVAESPASILLPPSHYGTEESAAPGSMVVGLREEGLQEHRSPPVPQPLYAQNLSKPAPAVTEPLFIADAVMVVQDPVKIPTEPEEDKALCTLTKKRCSFILTVCAAIVVVVVAYSLGGVTSAEAGVDDLAKNPTKSPVLVPPPANSVETPVTSPETPPAEDLAKNPATHPTLRTTADPTGRPTDSTSGPTRDPTKNPTRNPMRDSTRDPTKNPTKNPTRDPTRDPTKNPTKNPTRDPTPVPTKSSVVTGQSFQNLEELDDAVVVWMEAGMIDGEIENWNTGAVRDMSCLFNGDENSGEGQDECGYNRKSFKNQIATWDRFLDHHYSNDVGNWVRENDEDRTYFNADIGRWDVSGVTSMAFTLSNCEIFNKDISDWDVQSVTDMRNMFRYANSFNIDLNSWDVSNVTSLLATFKQSKAFNINLSDWDVGRVIDFKWTFQKDVVYDAGCVEWDVSGGRVDGPWEETNGKFC